MKNKLNILIAGAAILLSGCSESPLTASFDLTYAAIYTVPAGTVADTTIEDSTDPLSLNAADFNANNADITKVTSGRIKSCVLTILSPNSENFSFLDEVRLSIKGEDLTEMLVASKTNVDANATSIEMDVEEVNIVEHLKTSSFVLSGTSVTDEDLTVDVDVQAEVVITVKADVL